MSDDDEFDIEPVVVDGAKGAASPLESPDSPPSESPASPPSGMNPPAAEASPTKPPFSSQEVFLSDVYDLFEGRVRRDIANSRFLLVEMDKGTIIDGNNVAFIFINSRVVNFQEMHVMKPHLLDNKKKDLLRKGLTKKLNSLKSMMKPSDFTRTVANAVHTSKIGFQPKENPEDPEPDHEIEELESMLKKTVEQYRRRADELADLRSLETISDDYEFVDEFFKRMMSMEEMSRTIYALSILNEEAQLRKKVSKDVYSLVEPSFAYLKKKAELDEKNRAEVRRKIEEFETNGIQFNSVLREFLSSVPIVANPISEFDPSFAYQCCDFKSSYPSKSYSALEDFKKEMIDSLSHENPYKEYYEEAIATKKELKAKLDELLNRGSQ